jgi:hypothetical protein
MDDTANAEHLWDFEVQYRFYSPEEGGRPTGQPFLGYRCDWAYEGDDISKTGIYMIWPQFVAEDGGPLLKGASVPVSGTVQMAILSHEMRLNIHRHRIREGVQGYFMEGGRRVAEAVVTRVLGLHTNGDDKAPECAID